MATSNIGLRALTTPSAATNSWAVATTSASWAEVPTVGSFSEGVRNLESGKRITLRGADGIPLYPVSASEEELSDMYADLAMAVFVQERKIKELEEKINQIISK